jgi:hypothetical protein
MIWQAVRTGFEYFQREAGYTRTGSHSKRVNGRETGQWREADLVVAHWLQHTSRDGDMQLHVHSQIAHVARTATDGKWRAPDSLGYNEHVGAVAAVTAQHLEEALTQRFGLEWVARDDGHGFEIKGISGQMMRLFSSRRESITADLRTQARRFEQRYGRAPSQRELAQLAQASNFRTRTAKEGALDFAQLHAGWADKLARTLGVPLASVARSVWHATDGAKTPDSDDAATARRELEVNRAAQKAIALAQREKSTWTRADLVKYLGRVLPRSGMDPKAATALLEELADRALRSEFEPVVCLEAPEPAEVPASLRRADGRSVYQRHGGVRYATRAQLGMEERMVARASAEGAPRLARAAAAQALGADLARLERALEGHAQGTRDARDHQTGSGLREDQAAAAMSVLSDGRRVSVINAPAGAGKTYVLAQVGRAWEQAGLGRVIGVTPSQSARNTLAAGVAESYNSAQFLGHLPGQSGARGPVATGPSPLLVVDEASMVPSPDLADLITYAEASNGKVILAGDTSQLQAVQNGGGMSLLAGQLGHVQLTEPVRFKAAWERAASLRLRVGDVSALADYDQHARIRGGDPEQMIDAAATAYVALTVDGTDTMLMAADHALRKELSRRIRDDLIRLGRVQPGPAVAIADGIQASPGDLIICTRNDHAIEAGEAGRTLANGDLLRIEAITKEGPLVRRALDADPETGKRRWTDRHFLFANHETAELGYAVTDHTAQGRTVHTGLAVITGTEDRQHAYVALSRGTTTNMAYVFTVSPKVADLVPGPRPAPELARHDRIATAEAGQASPAAQATTEDALGILASVLERDGQQLSATQAQRQALADADHLAVLNAIWTAETSPARNQRYRDLLMAALPPGYQQEPGHQAKWLWQTLRAAELGGLDAAETLARAVGERDLIGARDIPSVIHARLRHRIGSLIPLAAAPWSDQLPEIPDPERRAFTAEIATMMDERKERIGEHAATSALPWAISALGPAPGTGPERLQWQRRASSIGAYRELSGYDHPTDSIGPEPVTGPPDLRSAWPRRHWGERQRPPARQGSSAATSPAGAGSRGVPQERLEPESHPGLPAGLRVLHPAYLRTMGPAAATGTHDGRRSRRDAGRASLLPALRDTDSALQPGHRPVPAGSPPAHLRGARRPGRPGLPQPRTRHHSAPDEAQRCRAAEPARQPEGDAAVHLLGHRRPADRAVPVGRGGSLPPAHERARLPHVPDGPLLAPPSAGPQRLTAAPGGRPPPGPQRRCYGVHRPVLPGRDRGVLPGQRAAGAVRRHRQAEDRARDAGTSSAGGLWPIHPAVPQDQLRRELRPWPSRLQRACRHPRAVRHLPPEPAGPVLERAPRAHGRPAP